MSKIEIEDDILQPLDELRVNFSGQNPFSICKAFETLLKKVLKISSSGVSEPDIRWDSTDDDRTFYGVWLGVKYYDRWTKTRIKVIAQGNQGKDGSGEIKIIIKGTLLTTYEYSNFVQKSFWWFYNMGFYYSQRRGYLSVTRDNIQQLKTEIQKFLDIYRG